MKNILIVCEKPYNRKIIEGYLREHMPKNAQLHFDNIAFITALDNKHIGNIVKTENGYKVGNANDGNLFQPLTLQNTELSTANYIISNAMREKRDFSVEYDCVLFACDPVMESLLSAFEYCERNNIDIKKACFVPVPCVTNEYMQNIFEKENWYPLTNPYTFTQFLYD